MAVYNPTSKVNYTKMIRFVGAAHRNICRKPRFIMSQYINFKNLY
ncbi:MAG: hypothetical protein RIR11_3832 [Bacteroidota bacterium]|jgi:hypothetical protein